MKVALILVVVAVGVYGQDGCNNHKLMGLWYTQDDMMVTATPQALYITGEFDNGEYGTGQVNVVVDGCTTTTLTFTVLSTKIGNEHVVEAPEGVTLVFVTSEKNPHVIPNQAKAISSEGSDPLCRNEWRVSEYTDGKYC